MDFPGTKLMNQAVLRTTLLEACGPLHVQAPRYQCWQGILVVVQLAGSEAHGWAPHGWAPQGGEPTLTELPECVIKRQQGCTFRKPCTTWDGLPCPSSLSAYMSMDLHRRAGPQAGLQLWQELSRTSSATFRECMLSAYISMNLHRQEAYSMRLMC